MKFISNIMLGSFEWHSFVPT